jgi:hypothetical protein
VAGQQKKNIGERKKIVAAAEFCSQRSLYKFFLLFFIFYFHVLMSIKTFRCDNEKAQARRSFARKKREFGCVSVLVYLSGLGDAKVCNTHKKNKFGYKDKKN